MNKFLHLYGPLFRPSPETNCYCPNDTFNAYCKSPAVSSNIASEFYSSTSIRQSEPLYNESSATLHYLTNSTLKTLEGNLSTDGIIELLPSTFPVTATEIATVHNTLLPPNTEQTAVLSPLSIEPKITSHANSLSLLTIKDSMIYRSTSMHTVVSGGASDAGLESNYTTTETLALSVLSSYRVSSNTTASIADSSLAPIMKDSLTITSADSTMSEAPSLAESMPVYTNIGGLTLLPSPSHRASLNTTAIIADPSLAPAIKESLTYMITSTDFTMSDAASLGESLPVYTSIGALTLLPSTSRGASSNTAATIADPTITPTTKDLLTYMPTSEGLTMSDAASLGESLPVYTSIGAVTLLPSPSHGTSSNTAATIADPSITPTIKDLLTYMPTSEGLTMSDAASLGESLPVYTSIGAVTLLPSPSHGTSSNTAATIADPSLAPTTKELLTYMPTSEGLTMSDAASLGESLPVYTSIGAVTSLPSPSHETSSNTAATIANPSLASTLVKSTITTMLYPQISEFVKEIASLLDHSGKDSATLSFSSLYEVFSNSSSLIEQSTANTMKGQASYFSASSSQKISDFAPTVESSSDFSRRESIFSPSSAMFSKITTHAHPSPTTEESMHQRSSTLFSLVPEPATGEKSTPDYTSDGPKTSFLPHSPGISSKSTGPINSSSVYTDSIIGSVKDIKGYISTSSIPEVSELTLSLESSSNYHRMELQSSFPSIQYDPTSQSITLPVPPSMESIQQSASHVFTSSYQTISEVSSVVKLSSEFTESTASYLLSYNTAFTSSVLPSTSSTKEFTVFLSSSSYPATSGSNSGAEVSSDLKTRYSVSSLMSLLFEMSSKSATPANPSVVGTTRSLESLSDYSMSESRSSFLSVLQEGPSRSPTLSLTASMETIQESVRHLSTSPYPTISEVSSIMESSSDHKSKDYIASSLSHSSEMFSGSTTLTNPSSVETTKQSSSLTFASSYSTISGPSSIEESMSPYTSKEPLLSSPSPSYEKFSTSASIVDQSSANAIVESTSLISSLLYLAISGSTVEGQSSLDSKSEESTTVRSLSSYEASSVSTSPSDPPSTSTVKKSISYLSTSSYSIVSEPPSIEESMSPYTSKKSLLSFLSPSYEVSSISNGILELSSVETKKISTSYISSTSYSMPSESIMQEQSYIDINSRQSRTLLLSSSYETSPSTGLSDPSSIYASKKSTSLRISNVASYATSSKKLSSSGMVRYLTSTFSLISSSSSSQIGSLARTSPVPPFETSLSPLSASLYSELSDFAVGATASEVTQVLSSTALSNPPAPLQNTTQAIYIKDSQSHSVWSTETEAFTVVSNVSTSAVVNQASIVSPIPTITTLTPGTTQPFTPVCLVICQLQLSEINTKPIAESYPKLPDSFKIAIVHFSFTDNATLRAYYNGSWHKVVNATVESALVLGSMEKVRYAFHDTLW